MKDKDIEKFARDSGLFKMCGGYLGASLYEGSNVVVADVIYEFAKLVEQATLERAAQEFEQDECDNWRSDVYAGHAVSRIIRALKGE